MIKLYLAHPISLNNAEEIISYFDAVTLSLQNWYDILSPMYEKDYLRIEKSLRSEGYENPIICNHAIFERDLWMVKNCEVLLCDFTGSSTASIGCCMELAVASWLHKHTVVVLPEDNIHNHAFIKEAADVIFTTLDDAITYLKKIAIN